MQTLLFANPVLFIFSSCHTFRMKRPFLFAFILLALGSAYLLWKNETETLNTKFVQLEYPKANQVVTSPLEVRGKARGMWFFEASFPVILQDDAGKTLAVIPAQAEGDWMTENFVPFKATLSFDTQAKMGKLILKKDNPSGLPEHEDQVEIPVRF